MQTVELTVRRTVGRSLVFQTKVLEVDANRDDPTIVVACPEGLDPLEHHFDASIAWTSALGRMEYAVTTRPERRGRGRVWLLTLTGPLTGVQKREYFRADVSIPVVVSWTDGPPAVSASTNGTEPQTHRLAGVVLDLSEGGVLASVSGVPPPVGTQVQSVLRIDDDEIVHAATVVRHVSLAGGTGVALAFADPSLHGDRLRQVAFEAERKRRRGD
ncbi:MULTISPECIES: PilZ domain-containing protein [Nocardioides]|uniref:PilZ domain-containing protein n=1 Tax=Nocardioides vastitatis TaxID=2568655 RepID=A0ABW0ZP66_9ACTN|nr:PilZ domain-containing protein [Nocardioides sp.]